MNLTQCHCIVQQFSSLYKTCFYRHLASSTVYHQIKPLQDQSVNIFDRNTKKLQRERAALAENVHLYDYLKDEVGDRLSDRIFDIKRDFNRVLDLGCGRGYVSKRVTSDNVKELIVVDTSEVLTKQASCDDEAVKIKHLVCDEERLSDAIEAESVDLVISNLVLHWVNDLPRCFSEIFKILKSDGVFMAALFGGDTLYELRSSLQLAELERDGGIAPHISPFTRVRDIGGLLGNAGYVMQTIDTDEIVVGYPSMFELIQDLKGMGENNASWNRKLHLPRDTMFAAASIYEQLYGKEEDGKKSVPASFQIISFVGWKPDPSQPQPIARGSGDVSLKDLYRLDEVVKETKKIPVDEEK